MKSFTSRKSLSYLTLAIGLLGNINNVKANDCDAFNGALGKIFDNSSKSVGPSSNNFGNFGNFDNFDFNNTNFDNFDFNNFGNFNNDGKKFDIDANNSNDSGNTNDCCSFNGVRCENNSVTEM